MNFKIYFLAVMFIPQDIALRFEKYQILTCDEILEVMHETSYQLLSFDLSVTNYEIFMREMNDLQETCKW